jgi:streptogramin lyase
MTWRTRLTLPLASLVVALGAGTQAHASLTEFTGLSAGSPAGIADGPDAAVWFAQQGSPGGLGRMTSSGALTEFTAGLTAGADPADVATGPDGALWFTEPGATDAIGRLDPATGTVTEYTVGLTQGSDPTAIVAGPDGNLWFTQPSKPGIGSITPAGTITEFGSGPSGAAPSDIAKGPDGNLWFTTTNPDRVARLAPGTGVVTEFTEDLSPAGAPAGITAGASGKLFFTEPGAGRVGRVKTDGSVETYSTGLTAGAEPAAIAEGGDGAIWFTDADEPGRIGRLWPASGEIQELTGGLAAGLSLGDAPGGIAQGPDGNVWFTQPGPLPRIVRVTVPPLAEISTPEPAEGGVRLVANVRPNSQPTTYFFDFGPTTAYGTSTATDSAGAGADGMKVTADVELARDAHYHVRVTAVNASGTASSSDRLFYLAADGTVLKQKPPKEERVDGTSTVDVAPAPVATDPVTEQVAEVLPPPAPVLGETIGLAPVSGSVRVKPPGASAFVALPAGSSVKVGSIVDTRRGTVELKTALGGGRTQKGRFWGAIFQVRQPRGSRGMTDLVLRGGRFSRCPSTSRGARASGVTRDVGRRGVIRRLWGRDRHGRFRTKGRDSVAAVRGTVWSTADRCDGTMTRVKQGAVLVRNRHTGRRVLVTAGHRHLARRPR